MASDAGQLSFDPSIVPAPAPMTEKRVRGFAGLSTGQIGAGLLLFGAVIWGMWATRELVELRSHKVVSVKLGELVNQFALAEARSGDDPDKVTARTRAFMQALDMALKARSQDGQIVLVGEAVVASPGEDITEAVAADVLRQVPMPVAQALPPRQPVAPVRSSLSGAVSGTGVAQTMSGAFGPPAVQAAGPGAFGAQQGYTAGGYQGGGDGQP